MRKASDVLSWVSRLRCTSAWLRSWRIASRATRPVTNATMIGLRGRSGREARTFRASAGLRIGRLQARVICRQRDVGGAVPAELDAVLALPVPQVAERAVVVQHLLHLAAVAHGGHVKGRQQRRAL